MPSPATSHVYVQDPRDSEADIFKLQNAYSSRYEKSLEQAMLSETEGKYKRVLLLAGCDGIAEAYAKVCRSAIEGAGARATAPSSPSGGSAIYVGLGSSFFLLPVI